MKYILIISLLVLGTWQTVHADQCAYIDQDETNNALDFLKIGTKYVVFCELCDDVDFYAQDIKTIRTLHVDKVDDKQWEISLNKSAIDLAYTFVKQEDGSFGNLSKLAECESDGVSMGFPAKKTAIKPQRISTSGASKYIPKSSERYQRYCNERFAFCLDYPRTLKKQFSQNGDGLTLNISGKPRANQANDFEVVVYGVPHGNSEVTPHTVKDTMYSAKQDIDDLTYQKKRANWFAVSGYVDSGETIVYEKTYVGRQNANTLSFRYPKKDKKLYDKVVNHMVASFKHGNLEPEAGEEPITEYNKD
jgi:hypothetical protein